MSRHIHIHLPVRDRRPVRDTAWDISISYRNVDKFKGRMTENQRILAATSEIAVAQVTRGVEVRGGTNIKIESLVRVGGRGGRDALNHLGEREYQTYNAWRAAAKAAGAVSFEGDKDIASAVGADGRHVGEWGGDKGSIYTK